MMINYFTMLNYFDSPKQALISCENSTKEMINETNGGIVTFILILNHTDLMLVTKCMWMILVSIDASSLEEILLDWYVQ